MYVITTYCEFAVNTPSCPDMTVEYNYLKHNIPTTYSSKVETDIYQVGIGNIL